VVSEGISDRAYCRAIGGFFAMNHLARAVRDQRYGAAMGDKPLSTHFLKRRADKRRAQIRRWQTDARTRPGDSVGAAAAERLSGLDVLLDDRIVVRKRGKWDARYEVVIAS
jgi:hypothetical protein